MIQDVKLRSADEAECRAGGFPSGAVALETSIKASDIYVEVRRDGEALAWFGCHAPSLMGSTALLWMLSTPAIEKHKIFAGRESVNFVRRFLELYPVLLAYVHTEHELSRKWLTWLGFRDIEISGDFIWMGLEKKDWRWGF